MATAVGAGRRGYRRHRRARRPRLHELAKGWRRTRRRWKLWVWTAIFAASIALAVLGFRGARWWRRGLSVAAIPLTLAVRAAGAEQLGGLLPDRAAGVGRPDLGPAARPDRHGRPGSAAQHPARHRQGGACRHSRRRERLQASARIRLPPTDLVHRGHSATASRGDDDRRGVQQPDQLDAHRQRDRRDRRATPRRMGEQRRCSSSSTPAEASTTTPNV